MRLKAGNRRVPWRSHKHSGRTFRYIISENWRKKLIVGTRGSLVACRWFWDGKFSMPSPLPWLRLKNCLCQHSLRGTNKWYRLGLLRPQAKAVLRDQSIDHECPLQLWLGLWLQSCLTNRERFAGIFWRGEGGCFWLAFLPFLRIIEVGTSSRWYQ